MKITKKQQVLCNTAKNLFWKYGFRRVTVEEICQQAGVSKMTFYRYYPDKMAIAKAVFIAESEKGMTEFSQLMEANTSAEEKIAGMLRQKAEAVKNISMEFLSDFYQSDDPDLRMFIAQKTEEAGQQIIKALKLAQERGVFSADFKPEFLLYMSQKMVHSLTDPYLLDLCGSPQEVIMEFTRFFSYGISNRPEKNENNAL